METTSNNSNPDIDTNGDGTPDTSYGFYVNGTTNADGSSSIDLVDMENAQTMQNTNPNFFNWVASQSTGSFSTLPVKLLYFKVRDTSEEGVTLEWVTTEEINFHYFELQRASSDLNFKTIEQIFSEGGPELSVRKYTFTDSHLFSGKNYYRLKNVDLDGQFSYSNIVVASGEFVTNTFFIYPNPVESNRVLHVDVTTSGFERIEILDARGSLILISNLGGIQNEIVLPSEILPGVYFVRIPGINIIKRFIVN